MGEDVIVLRPHRLQGSVLFRVRLTPSHRTRIQRSQLASDLNANYGDATETTMVSIPYMKLPLLFLRWHPNANSLILWEKRQPHLSDRR
jgi:hypothetical protein